jgi:hypothetical protein
VIFPPNYVVNNALTPATKTSIVTETITTMRIKFTLNREAVGGMVHMASFCMMADDEQFFDGRSRDACH